MNAEFELAVGHRHELAEPLAAVARVGAAGHTSDNHEIVVFVAAERREESAMLAGRTLHKILTGRRVRPF